MKMDPVEIGFVIGMAAIALLALSIPIAAVVTSKTADRRIERCQAHRECSAWFRECLTHSDSCHHKAMLLWPELKKEDR